MAPLGVDTESNKKTTTKKRTLHSQIVRAEENVRLSYGTVIESEVRPTSVQLKKKAKLSTVIGSFLLFSSIK